MPRKNQAQWQKADRLANPERYRAAERKNYQANIVARRWYGRRYKWLKQGIIIPDTAFPPPAFCEICGRRGVMHLDHDHATKRFRGWLCGLCNRMLGLSKDSPRVLEAAARYLAERTLGE